MEHRIRAAAIVVNGDKILLVKHVHPETGYEWWVPPGGGVEDIDDSIFDCAKRETLEETNLKIDTSKIIYIREFFDNENQKLNIEFFMLANNFDGDINLKNVKGNGPDEFFIKEIKWFTKAELQDIIIFPEILKDIFWDDYKNKFPNTKYLGRQIN